MSEFYDRLSQDPAWIGGLASIAGRDPQQAIANAQQMQARQLEMQQSQEAIKAQRALGERLAQSVGNITPDLVAETMRFNPQLGMRMRDQLLRQQEQEQRQKMLQSLPMFGGGGAQMGSGTSDQLVAAGIALGDPTLIAAGQFAYGREKDSPEAVAARESAKLEARAYAPMSPADEAAMENQKARAERDRANAAAKKQEQAQAMADIRLADESALSAMDEGINYIDELVGNPEKGIAPHAGFSSAVGSKALQPDYAFGIKDEPFEGSDSAGFLARQDQIQGGAFLTAVQKMRGLGALTEKEGDKAQASIIRMKDAVSEKEYMAAANDYRAVMNAARSRLVKKMQGTGQINKKNGGLESMSTEQLQQMLMEAK